MTRRRDTTQAAGVDDPEAAALELIVSRSLHFVGQAMAQQGQKWNPERLGSALQEFTGLLEVDGVFRDMTWHDAKLAAGMIGADLFGTTSTPSSAMLSRAIEARRGNAEAPWNDRERASDALQAAAMIYPRVRWG